MSHIFALTSNR